MENTKDLRKLSELLAVTYLPQVQSTPSLCKTIVAGASHLVNCLLCGLPFEVRNKHVQAKMSCLRNSSFAKAVASMNSMNSKVLEYFMLLC